MPAISRLCNFNVLFTNANNLDEKLNFNGATLAGDCTLRERKHLSELWDTLKNRTESGRNNLTIILMVFPRSFQKTELLQQQTQLKYLLPERQWPSVKNIRV